MRLFRRVLTLFLILISGHALAWTHGVATFSQRVVLNMNLFSPFDYAFINHLQEGASWLGPVGAAWNTGTVWNSAIFDANGYPNNAANGRNFGGSFHIPDSSNFAGPYIFQGRGSGRIQLLAGTWTEVTGTACNGQASGFGYTHLANGFWDVVDAGLGFCIVLTYSGALQSIPVVISQTDPLNSGLYLKALTFYRLADNTDRLAGKIFRAGFKQPIVTLDPSAIRFMNWGPGNVGSPQSRFENRPTPAAPGYAGVNWLYLPYGETTGTNQFALAGVSGTPVAMQHGEFAIPRIGTATTVNSQATVSAITNANPGVVTTSAPHGFTTGDKIIHVNIVGMTNLNWFPVTITVTDSTHYSIGVDTTSLGTFVSGKAAEFITLNVGARGAFPITLPDGFNPISEFSQGFTAGQYVQLTFDKNSGCQTDGSGNWVKGCWIWTVQNFGTPLEIATALVNELNAMSPAHPINMWVTLPMMGIGPSDPDYTTASDYAVNTVKTIMNGANGFSGLCSQCNLIVENLNESWNFAAGFWDTFYYARLGFLRYGGSVSDAVSYHTLRTVLAFEDIRSSAFMSNRVKFGMMGWANNSGTNSPSVGSVNGGRLLGNTNFNSDPLNIWSPAAPYTHYDAFGYASYFDADTSFDAANLATLAAAYAAHAGDPVAQEADCAAYVVGIVTGASGGQTISAFQVNRDPNYVSTLSALGKYFIQYEGGWDHSVTSGTTQVNNFLIAVKQSQAWANAQTAYLQSFQAAFKGMPSIYIGIDQRWGYAFQDTYSGGVEGAGYDKTWNAMGVYDAGIQ